MSSDVILYFQRKTVITGNVEPTDEECDWPSDDEKEDEQLSVKNPAVNNHTKCLLMKNHKNRIDQNIGQWQKASFLEKFSLSK